MAVMTPLRKNVTELHKLETLEILKETARKYSMIVKIIAQVGEQYEFHSGFPQIVPKGYVFIELLNSSNKDLTSFWSSYNRLAN